jgi:kynurenine 3-monooxygenase
MVTFLRVPYALAWARGEIQRGILMECCEGKARIEEIDLARADVLVASRLEVLDRGDAGSPAITEVSRSPQAQ